jgi:hypothetical protein
MFLHTIGRNVGRILIKYMSVMNLCTLCICYEPMYLLYFYEPIESCYICMLLKFYYLAEILLYMLLKFMFLKALANGGRGKK